MAATPDGRLRIRGALLALSTPVSGILSYAAVATVIGEDRLEGADGLSPLGWMAMAPPLIVGLAMIAWSFTDRPPPLAGGRRLVLLGVGAVLIALGLVALLTGQAGDPNIGSGLLIVAGIVALAATAIDRPTESTDPV